MCTARAYLVLYTPLPIPMPHTLAPLKLTPQMSSARANRAAALNEKRARLEEMKAKRAGQIENCEAK